MNEDPRLTYHLFNWQRHDSEGAFEECRLKLLCEGKEEWYDDTD